MKGERKIYRNLMLWVTENKSKVFGFSVEFEPTDFKRHIRYCKKASEEQLLELKDYFDKSIKLSSDLTYIEYRQFYLTVTLMTLEQNHGIDLWEQQCPF